MRKKWMKWGLLAVMSTTVLAACQSQPKNEADTVSGASIKTPREIIKSPVKKTDFLLGTAVSLSVYHPNSEALIESALEMIKDLEKKLRENFHYDYCRKLGQLKEIKLFILSGNPEREYIEACQNKNQKLGNIKMTALSKESGWENIFNGYFQESEDE